jgi:hypothetical protein
MRHHISPLKNNHENSRKVYYNPLRFINGAFTQQVGLPHHHSPLKINSENFRKIYFCKLVPQLQRNKDVVPTDLNFCP